MGMGKGSAPSGPDPTAVGNEQIAVNQATINQLAAANRINSNNPLTGGTTWTQDPTTGQWTQNTSLSPISREQQVQQLTNQNLGLGTLGNAEQRLIGSSAPGSALNTSGLPPVQGGSAVNTGGITSSVGPAGKIQTSIASATGDPAIAQAQNSTYAQLTSRLDPQWNQAQEQLTASLTAQGIPQNSTAWNQAMDDFNRQKTDAYNTASNQAVQTGNQEQSTLFGQAATSGQFANTAQNQSFQQQLSDAGFTNTAQQQQFMEQAQQAGMTNAQIQQQLQMMITQRTEPINEVNALAGGSQVTPPPGAVTGNASTDGAPNMLGANQLNYAGNLAAYNSNVGQTNSLMGSLLGLGMTPTKTGTNGGVGSSLIGQGLGKLGGAIKSL